MKSQLVSPLRLSCGFRCRVTTHRADSWETYLTRRNVERVPENNHSCHAGVAEAWSGVRLGLISASALPSLPGCSQMAPFSPCPSTEASLEINTSGIKGGISPTIKSAWWYLQNKPVYSELYICFQACWTTNLVRLRLTGSLMLLNVLFLLLKPRLKK